MHAKTHRQLSLSIDAAEPPARVIRASKITAILTATPDLPAQIDQVLSTRDIVKITGRHRVTIYRWIRAGIFPRKHEAHGHKVGWLRSEVERWLQRSPPPAS
jgi:prophage regulatory protein